MELDASLGGQMQKQVECNQELLKVSLPMLEACDAQFSDWYRSKKGPNAIHKLVRLQSFITRYRVNPDESAGLLRHIDGVQVCAHGPADRSLKSDSSDRGGSAHSNVPLLLPPPCFTGGWISDPCASDGRGVARQRRRCHGMGGSRGGRGPVGLCDEPWRYMLP